MSKKKSFLRGATILAVGGLLAKVIGVFFRIPMVRILGDFGSGLYGNAYPIYSFFLAVSVTGIPVAISKMVSERVSLDDYDGAYKVYRVAMLTMLVAGLVGSLVMLFGAKLFISLFGWHPNTYYSIIALSPAPLIVAVMATYRGFFQGMQTMTPTSVSQIIEAFGRVIVGLGLCIVLTNSISVAYGAAGATFGATGGAVLGCLYIVIAFLFYKHNLKIQIKKQKHKSQETARSIFRTLVAIAVPVTLATLVSNAMNMVNSATVSRFLVDAGLNLEMATELWGQLSGKVQTLVNLPFVFATAIAGSLVPAISESFVKNDKRSIILKTDAALKVIVMVALPCAFGLSILASPITELLYGSDSGYYMLTFLAFSCVFTMASICMQSILQGVGKFMVPVRNLAVGIVIKLILNFVFIPIPSVNIMGAVYSSIVAEGVIMALDALSVRKYVGFKFGLAASFSRSLLCALLMSVITAASYALASAFIGSLTVCVGISILLSAIVYGAGVLILKPIYKKDIEQIRG